MYQLILTKKFEKSFRKLDKQVQCLIKKWIEVNLIDCDDPRVHGKALAGNLSLRMSIRIILSQARHIGFNMDSILKPISSSTVYKKEHTKKTTRQIIARLSFLFFFSSSFVLFSL